jgi:hypothetical protein
MTIVERKSNFIVVENYTGNRTPFDLLDKCPRWKEDDKYKEVMLILESGEFDAHTINKVLDDMDNCVVSSDRIYNHLLSAMCYPKGHDRRQIY